VPRAQYCVLVDTEGETVDFASTGQDDPFNMQVVAAQMRLLLADVEGASAVGAPLSVVLRSSERTTLARSLPGGYALVLVQSRAAGLGVLSKAVAVCEREIADEAGWPSPPGAARWYAISVQTDARGRPVAAGNPPLPVTVVGAVARRAAHPEGDGISLKPRGFSTAERPYRVATASGAECTLVRERTGIWYADELLVDLRLHGEVARYGEPLSRE